MATLTLDISDEVMADLEFAAKSAGVSVEPHVAAEIERGVALDRKYAVYLEGKRGSRPPR